MVKKCAVYVTKILRCFGIVEGAEDVGFSIPNVNTNKEGMLAPFVDQVVALREAVRAVARGNAAADEVIACVAAQDAEMKVLGVTVGGVAGKGNGGGWTAEDKTLAASVSETAAVQNNGPS